MEPETQMLYLGWGKGNMNKVDLLNELSETKRT